MSRTRVLAVAAGLGLMLATALPPAAAAPFAVYYRSSASNPWVFYSGQDTKAATQAVVTELQGLGYQTEILNDAEPPPKTMVVDAPAASTVVSGGGVSGAGVSVGGGGGRSGYSSSSSSYSAAGSSSRSSTPLHPAHHPSEHHC
jgi:hypothetical protein